MTFPTTDPVLQFALLMFVLLVAPLVSKRMGIPSVVGMILSGVLIGPYGMGLMDRDVPIVLFGTVGLLYIMFVSGIELDLFEFKKNSRRSLCFGLLTFFIPMGLGMIVGLYVLKFSLLASVLLASVFASHTLLAYPAISVLGLTRREAVIISIGGTMVTDVLAMVVLAVVAAISRGDMTVSLWGKLAAAIFLVVPGMLLIIPWIGKKFLRVVGGDGHAQFLFILTVVFSCAYIVHLFGIEPIIGAFAAGLALNRLIPTASTLMNRVLFFGNAFFIPLFLISVGMLVDFQSLIRNRHSWEVSIAMIVTVTASKMMAAKVTQWIYKYTSDEGYVIFSLSLAQAAATLAAVLIGVQLKIFDEHVLNGTVVMILVSCIIAAWSAEFFGKRVALSEVTAAPQAREGRERFMVPISNPRTADALVEFAVLLRGNTEESGGIHILQVVPSSQDVDVLVARSEHLLTECVSRCADAGVPFVPTIRVDLSATEGILRAVQDLQITTIVLGWNGENTGPQRIFGGVFDQVLEGCDRRLMVCRISQAFNTVERVVIVLPPHSGLNPRFEANLSHFKSVAKRLSATIAVFSTAEHRADLEDRLNRVRPAMPLTLEVFQTWKETRDALLNSVKPTDLVVLFSARRGAASWLSDLDRMPRVLTEKHPEALLVVLFPAAYEEDEVTVR